MQNVRVTTLSDIAERMGISVNTVSRALRNCSDIGASTKAAVKKIADEMGYQPNKVASFMRTKKSNIIAVVISSLSNPFFSISLDFVFDYLTKKNYHPLIIVKKEGDLSVEEVVRCMQSGACGILTFIDLDEETADYCETYKIPVLLCGSRPRDERISAVYSDDNRCGKLVAQEAVSHGAKNPCYINGALSDLNNGRRNGFIKVLENAGIHCDSYSFDYEDREASAEAIKKQIAENANDFIFCFNDEIATVMLKAFDADGGFKGEIFGVDGISKYLPYSRSVNSVGGDLQSIANRCGHILLEKVEKGDVKIVREVFPTEIILR